MLSLIFDCETTGLIDSHLLKLDRQSSIIEFYACLADLRDGTVTRELDLLIKPPGEISEKITKITGISTAMVADAPAFRSVAAGVREVIESAPVVIAHNASFDIEMVNLEFERLGEKIRWPRVICSVEASIHIKGFRLSLGALHEELFAEKFTGAHRAKADVAALRRCCVEMHRRGDL